jgi:hypothetical protein
MVEDRMNRWVTLTTGFLVSALCCNVVSAAVLAVDCLNIGPVPTELNVNLACPQFNLAGQVSSISIELTGAIGGALSLTNNGQITQSATATTTSQFSVNLIDGSGPGPASGFAWTNPLFVVSPTTGPVNVLPGQTFSIPLSASQSSTLGPDTTQISRYVGPGSFDINVTTLTGLSALGGGGQITVGQSTNAEIFGQVTYTYSLVPEPSVLLLIPVGLLGLGIAAHSRAQLAARLASVSRCGQFLSAL